MHIDIGSFREVPHEVNPAFPNEFHVDLDLLPIEMLIDGRSIYQYSLGSREIYTYSDDIPDIKEYYARVYQARIDKENLGFIRKFPNICKLEYTTKKNASFPQEILDTWNLQVLEFDSCTKFKKVPRNLPKAKNLMALGFTNCRNLEDISLLAELPHLTHLSFDRLAKLQDFTHIGALKNIQQLHLEAMHREELPEILSSLSSLKRLSLASYGLNDQSNWSVLEPLTQLEELDLGCNNITVLPTEIKSLSALRRLSLKHLTIEDVTPLLDLPHLEVIEFTKYQGRQLPIGLEKLTNLKELHFTYAEHLSGELTYPDFKHCPQLEIVNFSASNVTKDQVMKHFAQLPHIKKLYVEFYNNLLA